MKRHVRLFLLYFAQYAKVRLAYKADFFIAFFSSMTATVLGFGFVLVLFTKIPRLEGWSFYEILFLYAFSLLPLGFFNVVSWNLYEFGDIYIIQGRFDRILLRPVDTLFQVLFEKFRIESLQEVVTGLLVVTVCVGKLGLSWSVADSLWFALMVACGAAWLAGTLWGGLVFVHRGPLVQLVLAYPRLRPGSRVAATVIGVAYVCAVVAPLARSSAVTVALVVAMMAAGRPCPPANHLCTRVPNQPPGWTAPASAGVLGTGDSYT